MSVVHTVRRRLLGRRHGRRVMAEFAHPETMLGALDVLRRGRYAQIETYTPFDLPEVDERLARRPSRLRWVALAGGIAGLVVAYGIQWWANVHEYPLNAGGRPVHAVPAFIPATFEGTVLGAALLLFVSLLLRLGFPRLWDPVDDVDGFQRATSDRFWIVVDGIGSDADCAHAERLLSEAGARRTVSVTMR